MKDIATGFFPDRFAVSAEGMVELNKDRFERLVYELIQNVFDEDSATTLRSAFTTTSMSARG